MLVWARVVGAVWGAEQEGGAGGSPCVMNGAVLPTLGAKEVSIYSRGQVWTPLNSVLEKRLPGRGWVGENWAAVWPGARFGGGWCTLGSGGALEPGPRGLGLSSVLKRAIMAFLKQENDLKLLFFPETTCSLPQETPQTVIHRVIKSRRLKSSNFCFSIRQAFFFSFSFSVII